MKRIFVLLCGAALVVACSRGPATLSAAAAETTDPKAAAVPASGADGRAVGSTGPASDYREVTIPAGTVLPVDLETSVGSDISRVEQPVHGSLRRAVFIRGIEVLPAGTAISGHVTAAQRPGKVKGRGMVAMRFTQLDTPGEGTTRISTATVSRLAPATKEKDALKIIAPAAGGAVIGKIVGGSSGAAKGAVIGGAAGTGYVLSTRGKEVRLGRGANLAVRLTAPVTVRILK
jgi:hypothetical protein